MCPSRRMLSTYLDGGLHPSVRRRLERHLAGCGRCARRLAEMEAVDRLLRALAAPVEGPVPALAPRVTEALRRRGAFLRARVEAGRRRLFGRPGPTWRGAVSLGAAAALVFVGLAFLDWASEALWSRRAAPTLVDAEHVLVRLVHVPPGEAERRLAWARAETRRLALPQRLREVRAEAAPNWEPALASLEAAFRRLAAEEPLAPDLWACLERGDLLARTSRLRRRLGGDG